VTGKFLALARTLLKKDTRATLSPKALANPTTQAQPHAAYLLIDCSGSMRDCLPEAVDGALGFFSGALRRDYYVGLIRFSSRPDLLLEPTRDKSAIERVLRGLIVEGSTNMAEAIGLAAHALDIGEFPRAIVLVTDGMPDDAGGHATLEAARRARRSGIDIIAIGTGSADHAFLSKLVNRTDLATKVDRPQLRQAITSAAHLLPRA